MVWASLRRAKPLIARRRLSPDPEPAASTGDASHVGVDVGVCVDLGERRRLSRNPFAADARPERGRLLPDSEPADVNTREFVCTRLRVRKVVCVCMYLLVCKFVCLLLSLCICALVSVSVCLFLSALACV